MTPEERATHLLAEAHNRQPNWITINQDYITKIIANGHCQVTNLLFDLTDPNGPFSPSLDRSDPTLGYTIENTRVVVLIYNAAKSKWSHEAVLQLANSLANTGTSMPVSVGELCDKLSILRIKLNKITDQNKLANINTEYRALHAVYLTHIGTSSRQADLTQQLSELETQLQTANAKIWDIEDAIRDCERNKDFGPKFIELARGVYHNNDERARIKRVINDLLGSKIVEEKSYTDYTGTKS